MRHGQRSPTVAGILDFLFEDIQLKLLLRKATIFDGELGLLLQRTTLFKTVVADVPAQQSSEYGVLVSEFPDSRASLT